jgi:peptidoglycan/xylan/chitin deacetylase (PgdA/CDA1 family)
MNDLYPRHGLIKYWLLKRLGNGYRLGRVTIPQKCIAITFDDGPHKTLTPKLLDLLDCYGIKATFFVQGGKVKQHPEIVKRASEEGHEVANHGWNHPQLPKCDCWELHHQLADTSALIRKATGKKVTLMRPPYGEVNSLIYNTIESQYGLKVIHWSVTPNDWTRPGIFALMHRITTNTSPGAIILLHDTHKGTIDAIPAMLDSLLPRGFKFVTISELLALQAKADKATKRKK